MLSTFVPPRAAQDLTVTLVRMEGDTQIFVADFTGRNIVESIVPEVGGRMYLIVTSFGGFPQTGINGAYSIAWTRTYPSTCQPEPNNGTPSTTQTITPDRLIVGDLCRSDLDFYRVSDVEPGDVVSIELNFAESPEVLVDVWRNAVIVSPDQRVRNGHRHTHARVMDNEPLIFAVRPFGPAPTSGRSYILTVKRIRAAELECDNPDRERPGGFENDSINTAQDLPSARDITGFICPGDVDVFYVGDYQVDDQFDARLAFDAAQNLDAYLFRDDINFLLQNALTDTMPEILPTRIPSAGSYYVMVIGRDENQTSPYTLEVD